MEHPEENSVTSDITGMLEMVSGQLRSSSLGTTVNNTVPGQTINVHRSDQLDLSDDLLKAVQARENSLIMYIIFKVLRFDSHTLNTLPARGWLVQKLSDLRTQPQNTSSISETEDYRRLLALVRWAAERLRTMRTMTATLKLPDALVFSIFSKAEAVISLSSAQILGQILHHAVKEQNEVITKELLNQGADVSICDSAGKRPIDYAAQVGNIKLVRLLIEHGAKVDLGEKKRDQPLHYAAALGCEDLAELLINNGARIDARTERVGWQALHVAARNGQLAMARWLLDHKADVNAEDENKDRPLHLAVRANQLKIVRLLIQRGADINARNGEDEQPIHIATVHGFNAILEFLLRKRSDINALNQRIEWDEAFNKVVRLLCPIYIAAIAGHLTTVQLLADWGANLTAEDDRGFQPIHYAAEHGNIGLVAWLVEKGVPVDSISSKTYSRPLIIAAATGHIKLVEWLLNHGAYVNRIEYKESDGVVQGVPLILAALAGYIDVVRLLVKHGASLHVRGMEGGQAIHFAAVAGHEVVVECLVELGADLFALDDHGNQPIHWAAQSGHIEMVQWLLDHGVSKNVVNHAGQSPFDCAEQEKSGFLDRCERILELLSQKPDFLDREDVALPHSAGCVTGRLGETVNSIAESDLDNIEFPLITAAAVGDVGKIELLIQQGADVRERGRKGAQAIHYAAAEGHIAAIECLVRRGASLTAQDEYTDQPIHYAARSGRLEVIAWLHGRGISLDSCGCNGMKPLHYAVQAGNRELAGWLVAHGAAILIGDREDAQPIHYAVFYGHLDMMQLIVKQDARAISEKEKNGRRAIHYAACHPNVDVIKWLVEQGALPLVRDLFDMEPIQYAALMGNRAVVEYLVSLGIDLRAVYNQGRQLVHYAAAGSVDCIEWLAEKGMSIDVIDALGRQPLCYAIIKRNMPMVRWLIDQKNDLFKVDSNNKGLIDYAVETGDTEIVAYLLSKGMTVKPQQAGLLVHKAARNGHLEMIQMLAHEYGENILQAADDKGMQAIHVAAAAGQKDVVEYLINRGTDKCVRDKNGFQPIHYAVGRSMKIVDYLCSLGVNIKSVDSRGVQPIHLAAALGLSWMVEWLVAHGADIEAEDNGGKKPLDYAQKQGHAWVVERVIIKRRS